MLSWHDVLNRRSFWLSYYTMALLDPDIPLARLRPGLPEEEIDAMEKRIAGHELVVRFPGRYALRFAFRNEGHELWLSSPGRARVKLGENNPSGYPGAFRRREIEAVVECLRAHPDGRPVDPDRLTLLLLMYHCPETRRDSAWGRALLRERLVADGLFRPGEAAEFAWATFRPDRYIPWVLNPEGEWVAGQDCISLRNSEGDPFDHAALRGFLGSILRPGGKDHGPP